MSRDRAEGLYAIHTDEIQAEDPLPQAGEPLICWACDEVIVAGDIIEAEREGRKKAFCRDCWPEWHCRECGDFYDFGRGDGYDGLCPGCADRESCEGDE